MGRAMRRRIRGMGENKGIRTVLHFNCLARFIQGKTSGAFLLHFLHSSLPPPVLPTYSGLSSLKKGMICG